MWEQVLTFLQIFPLVLPRFATAAAVSLTFAPWGSLVINKTDILPHEAIVFVELLLALIVFLRNLSSDSRVLEGSVRSVWRLLLEELTFILTIFSVLDKNTGDDVCLDVFIYAFTYKSVTIHTKLLFMKESRLLWPNYAVGQLFWRVWIRLTQTMLIHSLALLLSYHIMLLLSLAYDMVQWFLKS